MQNQNISIGEMGEDIACEFLLNKKYRVLVRNYWKPWGEIDIVARAYDGTVVFVEVKTMKEGGPEALAPEDNVSAAKLLKLRRTCEAFARANPHLIRPKKGWRLDLVAITLLLEEGIPPRIVHYENI